MTAWRVTRWWWLRHGPLAEPGRIAGQADAPLAPWPEPFVPPHTLPPGALWLTSPLTRCRATARRLAGDDVDRTQMDPRLMEQHFGDWQGRRHADLADDPLYHAFWLDAAHAAPPQGESFAEQCHRVAAAVTEWSDRAAKGEPGGGTDVVAVAHAGTIRAALAQALVLDPATALAFEVAPLSLTRVDRLVGTRGPPQWRVVGVNLPAAS